MNKTDNEEKRAVKLGKMSAAFKKARKERAKASKSFYGEFVGGLKEAYVKVDEAL